MSSEFVGENETVNQSMLMSTDTHGIGDSALEKFPSPCLSRESFYEISEGSSHNSCASFKAICRAWKCRAEHNSGLSLEHRKEELEVKVENLTKRLSTTENDDESRELAKSLSTYVMMEGRPLQLTESSDENIPSGAGAGHYTKRFFTPEEIREAFGIFKMCAEKSDNYIELNELKLALEKLAVPQTHLAAKELIAEVAGENATKLSFCQFLLIYAAALQNRRGNANARNNSHTELLEIDDPINVSEVGVSGAKLFFEAKIAQQKAEKSPELPKPILFDSQTHYAHI